MIKFLIKLITSILFVDVIESLVVDGFEYRFMSCVDPPTVDSEGVWSTAVLKVQYGGNLYAYN